MVPIADRYGIALVEEVDFRQYTDKEFKSTAEQFEFLAKTVQGIEGWVIQFGDGDMVKLKTDWYLSLHKKIVFLTERDIAELVLNEQIDDYKSMLVGEGVDIAEILTVETNVNSLVTSIYEECELAYNTLKDLPRREYVEHANALRYSKLIINRMSHGSETFYENVVKFVKQHLLKEMFSLRQLNF